MKTINEFMFFVPTRIQYGRGVVRTLISEIKGLGAKKPLIVTDKGIIQAGIIEPIKKDLEKNGFEVNIFDNILANPRDVNCEEGTLFAKEVGADIIIAVGGGSPLDTAKVIAMLLTNPGSVNDYFGYNIPKHRGILLITIPTTAGTGSEVTIWAVITNTRSGVNNVKECIGSSLICPTVALVDPLLTIGLPSHLTAYTGMDALTHAIEAYTSLAANPVTDMYALEAIRLISRYLAPACTNGENIEARDHMMLGQLLAGVAFSNSDVAAVHALAETIGGLYDVPHGVANAIFLPYTMEYNIISKPEKYANIARMMGINIERQDVIEAAYKSVEGVKRLARLIDIPDLKTIGVKKEDFGLISLIAQRNLGTPYNPRKMTEEGYLKILEKAYEGK